MLCHRTIIGDRHFHVCESARLKRHHSNRHQKSFHGSIPQHENGDHQLWCDGTTLGFSSYLVIYPELNSGIVLLANECDASTPDKLGGIAYEIFKEISQK